MAAHFIVCGIDGAGPVIGNIAARENAEINAVNKDISAIKSITFSLAPKIKYAGMVTEITGFTYIIALKFSSFIALNICVIPFVGYRLAGD